MYVDELAGKDWKSKYLLSYYFNSHFLSLPTHSPCHTPCIADDLRKHGEFSELTALKSSGIPLSRIMRPLILLIGVISIVSFFFSNNVLPYSNRQARTLLYDIRRKRPDINLQAGTFNNDIDGFSIKITSKDPVTNRLNRLYIYDHRENRAIQQ